MNKQLITAIANLVTTSRSAGWRRGSSFDDTKANTEETEALKALQNKVNALEKAYKLARDAGARLLYYSDDRSIGDVCENELQEAETLYRHLTKEE